MGEHQQEQQRANGEGGVGGARPGTMSETQFLSWKRQKDAETSARRVEAARKRDEDIVAGRVQMNGRELFLHEPWVFDNAQY